jgi:hypothetical protein
MGLNLWKVQNTYWEMLQKIAPAFHERAAGGDEAARSWVERFKALGERLGFAAKPLQVGAQEMKVGSPEMEVAA